MQIPFRTRALVIVTLAVVIGAIGWTLLATSDSSALPRQNLDHWRSPYGVWSCFENDGEGGWIPHFSSSDDAVGIHSHDDGVISIHPFFPESAGENATVGHFFTAMRAELSDDALTLDTGQVLDESTPCPDGEMPVVHVRRWSDPSGSADPDIITDNLLQARFRSDGELWQFVVAPLDAAVPELPAERIRNRTWVEDPEYPGSEVEAGA